MLPTKKISTALNLDTLQTYISDTKSNHPSKKYYPLTKWHPSELCEMDLTIKANGEWWHEGVKMTRQSIVDYFSSLLWLEEEKQTKSYYLKTPVQQFKIVVEDAPLLITDVNLIKSDSIATDKNGESANKSTIKATEQYNSADKRNDHCVIEFVTQTNDRVCLDDEHLIYFAKYQDDVRPYIRIRDNLHALISRSVFYHLLEIGTVTEKNGDTVLSLQSGYQVFDSLFVE